MHIYVNKVAYAEHIALVKGDVADAASRCWCACMR